MGKQKKTYTPEEETKVPEEETFTTEEETKVPEEETLPAEHSKAPAVAPCDTAIYHNEHEPRSLRQGDVIPEGWTMEPGKLTVKWQNNSDGSWFKIPV